jgi:carbon-monoxide dehydrogenase small subunit
MLMAAKNWSSSGPANRAEVREWISGNYCRCRYHAIVDAICEVLQQRKAAASLMEAPA